LEVEDFLNPTLRASMSDPQSLKDCAKAADILHSAIQNQQKIAIFADYDVDGGTSAALLIDFLRQFAIESYPLCARSDHRGLWAQSQGDGRFGRSPMI
jgi:single-stranded-DNA-specific exonuclease